jgi:hypothetical protein
MAARRRARLPRLGVEPLSEPRLRQVMLEKPERFRVWTLQEVRSAPPQLGQEWAFGPGCNRRRA